MDFTKLLLFWDWFKYFILIANYAVLIIGFFMLLDYKF